MATFLELAQKLHRKALGIGGATTLPSAVTGQTGELQRIVEYIADAYTRIQTESDYKWLRRKFTLTTSASTDTYAYTACTDVLASAAISRFGRWRIEGADRPKIYLTAL